MIANAKLEAPEDQKLLNSSVKEQMKSCSESLAKKISILSAASILNIICVM